MSESFPNAPLVELMVEVQWHHPAQVDDDQAGQDQASDRLRDEEFAGLYEEISRGLAREGHTRSERLIPRGMQVDLHSPLYRYTDSGNDAGKIVYQVGPGIFSINAVPPYKSWEDFRPAVVSGLRVLFDSLAVSGSPSEASSLELRYIDAFRDEFLEGATRQEFLAKTLGFGITLPEALARQLASNYDPKFFLQFTAPLISGGDFSIRAGEAIVRNDKAVVLDMSVTRSSNIIWQVEDLVTNLDAAHEVINSSFLELTKPVHHILRGEIR